MQIHNPIAKCGTLFALVVQRDPVADPTHHRKLQKAAGRLVHTNLLMVSDCTMSLLCNEKWHEGILQVYPYKRRV